MAPALRMTRSIKEKLQVFFFSLPMPLKGSSVFVVVSNEVVTSRVRNWATAEAFYFKDTILPTAARLRYAT
ncbi:hypothetical protein I7I53_10732 [Histoplasma capsulatum var. duboisii H88]|uniref:Uncharacterized protein n=1 Tax=Ajellomyces capsulatus (strain H88) TaxID=544711 RepID=A0A8A1L7Q8_AJEC8|nr:hypothetical protein I7I53_10732 [Histoplasma capsulatum var. duboisii H88]